MRIGDSESTVSFIVEYIIEFIHRIIYSIHFVHWDRASEKCYIFSNGIDSTRRVRRDEFGSEDVVDIECLLSSDGTDNFDLIPELSIASRSK